MSFPLIEVKGLSYRYGISKMPVLEDINMSIFTGEFVVITGPSGCGKSTLCRCLNGLIPHTSDGAFTGDVLVHGKNTREWDISDLSSHMGTVFQDPENQLLANLVETEIAFGPENLGLSPEDIDERVAWALSVTGIDYLRYRLTDELSGGEKQRVAIAAAMAMKPEILLLDEPTSEIDPTGAKTIIDTLQSLNEDEGLTIVLIDHKIERLLGAMSRLVVLDAGKIVYDGRPDKVFKNDLETMGVIMPPLVKFSRRFGLPYFRNVCDISKNSTLHAGIGKHPAERGDLIASFQDIHYRYPGSKSDALKGVSLDIYRREVLAIMGANGSGKTTLIKHMNGLLRPYEGNVLLNGQDIEKQTIAENSRTVGYVFQNVNHQLFEETVLDELLFAPANMGMPRENATIRAHEVADSLGIGERLLMSSPFLLSGGEKQRVAIASSLIMGPDVFVLDEPTLGMNHGIKVKLAAILEEIKHENKAVVLVTHDIEFAAAHADRIVLMSGGRVIADGSARDVLTSDLVEGASLHSPQATDIGKWLGIDGILSVDELVGGVP
jgi:energy-coupling factor transport system ATP-binding protein